MKQLFTLAAILYCTASYVLSQTPMSVEYLPNMVHSRVSHGMMVPSDNKVVVIGGHTDGFQLTNTAESLNLSPAVWTASTSLTPHDMPFVSKLNDGRYMIGGGCSWGWGVGQLAACEIYDASTGLFIPSTPMSVARTNASAATLKDGAVLVCGNWYASATTSDLFNPQTNMFQPTGPCAVQRALPVVIPTEDGGAMVLGGIGPYGERLTSGFVEKYNRQTNSFQLLPDTLTNGKTLLGINCGQPSFSYQRQLANGKYALLDYNDEANIRIITIDPVTCKMEELSLGTPISLTDKDQIAYGCNRNLMIDKTNNLIHLIQVGASGTEYILRIVTINLNVNSVHEAKLSGFDFNVATSVMEVLADGRILFTGGNKPDNFTMSKKAFIVTPATYAPASGIQMTPMSVQNLPDMTYSRNAQCMIVPNSQKVVVVGGHTEGFDLTNVVETCNFASSSSGWQALSPVYVHDGPFMARLNDGKYLIGAGASSGSGVGQSANTEIYNPLTDAFSAAANLNVARVNASAATLKNGRVLVVGNWYASSATGEVYDPSTNAFTATGNCVFERALPVILPTNDNGALVFGNCSPYGDRTPNSFLQKYDATTNSFSALPDTLSNGKMLLGVESGQPCMDYQRLMADGKYALLDLYPYTPSVARLISVDPATSIIDEIPIDPTNLLSVDGVQFYCNRNLMIDKQRNLIHIVQSTGASPYVLRIVTHNLNNGTTNASTLDGIDYFAASSPMEILSDGRILFTGGNKPDNFTLSNKAFIITPATYVPTSLAYPKASELHGLWDNLGQGISLSQDVSGATLYNLKGQVIHTFGRGHFFPVEGLPSGLYLLKVNSGQTLKILK